jgi:6-phosphogluconolactonase (cycloisomerase 2 family)
MIQPAKDSNDVSNRALQGRKRSYLSSALRLAPTLAALSLWSVALGACGRSVFHEASNSPSPTSIITNSPTATATITPSPTPTATITPSPTPVAAITPSLGTGNSLYSSNLNAGTIAEFMRDSITGALSLVGSVAAGSASGPIGIATGPSAKYIYAVNSADDQVRQYKVHPTNGTLTLLGSGKIAAGSSPQWIAITPNTDFAFVTNSGDGSISPYRINSETGALTANGSAASSSLIKEPITAVASDNFLYVTDSTNGSVVTFPIQGAGTLGDGKTTSLNPAQGPAAVPGPIIMNSAKTFVYATDQQKGVVYFLKVGGGVLTLANSYASTGNGGSMGLAIATTSSGLNFMYVANQTAIPPSISAFLVNGDGTLTDLRPPQYFDASLSQPTGVAVDPTGSFLYVANQGTGIISRFSISSTTGALGVGVPVDTASASSGPFYLSFAH